MDNDPAIEIKAPNADHSSTILTLTNTKISQDDSSLKDELSKMIKYEQC